MSDPFESLRAPIEAVDPDPLFAAHLRARLARALALPQGVTVSDLALDPTRPPAPAATGATALVPYLIVSDARRALAWYADAMGGRLEGQPVVMGDGRIGHAEVRLGAAAFYLADESPQSDVAAPQAGAGASVSLTLEVIDVDELTERAVQRGARLERPAADYAYGRNAVIWDPFGHRWIVSAPAGAPHRPAQATVARGDVAYLSLWVPDGDRAANFFARVLGWTVDPLPEGVGHARQVRGQSLPHGILGGQEYSSLFLCFAVESVDEAVMRVRGAGGTAGEPTDQPFGRVADCTDNQGVPFALVEVPPGSPKGPVNGDRPGDVAYLTMAVEDSAAARAFYREVLGWRFRAGRVEDGWEAEDVSPMVGMHGGHDRATVVPMYRVDDIHHAVELVRAQGGRSSDPEPQGYGVTADCFDDQGTHFYVVQF